MRIVTAWPLILAIVFLAVSFSPTGPSFSASPPDPNPHAHFQQPPQCPKCHVYSASKLEPERIRTDSIEFCLECHLAEERGRTHPLKVHPGGKFRGIKVPQEYRLGDGEHIICLTCHKGHGQFLSGTRTFAAQAPERLSAESGGAPVYRTYYLRRLDPARERLDALCEGCHRVP